MAGYVNVYKGKGFEGCVDLGSERVRWLVRYLEECQTQSPILSAEAGLDFRKDFGPSHYLTLAAYSNAVVAEVGRLLIIGAEPGHPFWTEHHQDLIDFFFWKEKDRVPEKDLNNTKAWIQKGFREVAAMIHERLELSTSVSTDTETSRNAGPAK